ncbi:protein TonB [Tenacibaculum sp. MAR_2009_124]|uniref:energy transducer TonB n=1 Tax=Tenacibaculum sp. MAR_2009_124 TaxID=1250059 RepID=UPI00089B628F|nr:energy transducer TonB [Tenacibaculum sp. MAR_2009_124]SEC54724.1 protein TonB [Tenacibaculum sp. MAR_2009_124]
MKMQKKHARKQLEKFSTIFTQLGLVLSLFIVYVLVEYESEKKEDVVIAYNHFDAEDMYTLDDRPVVFVKDVPKKKAAEVKRKIHVDITKVKIVDNEEDLRELIDLPTNEDKPLVDINKLDEVSDGDDIKESEDPIPMVNIQNAPVFKGCEGLSEKEGRLCLENKMKQYVRRYFDADLANDLGMRSGKYRIYTQFVIDKQGNVSDIKIKAPHVRLKKEVSKVINKLPQFTPGKQNSKPVKVSYMLPITFMVQ